MRCSARPFPYGEDSDPAGYQRLAAITKAQRSTGQARCGRQGPQGLISLNLVATIADDQWITRSGAACLGMKAAIDTDQAALRSLRIDSAVLFPGHRTGDAAART